MKRFLIAATAKGPRYDALTCLLFLSALRVSEVCSARLEDVGEHEGMTTLRFLAKGGTTSKVTLAPKTAWAISRLAGERTSGPIFIRRHGKPLDRRTAWFWVDQIRQAAGIEQRVSPHALRRSAITIALRNNGRLEDVQRFARHVDPRTTVAVYDQSRFEATTTTTLSLQALFSDA